MTPEQLRAIIDETGAQAARVGELPDQAEGGAPAGLHLRPVDGRTAGVVGDWVTPIAIRWAPALDLEAAELARVLAERLTQRPSIEAVEVAPNGLLTITLRDADRSAVIDTILRDSETYALPDGVGLADFAAGLGTAADGSGLMTGGARATPAARATEATKATRVSGASRSRGVDDPVYRAQRAHARLRRLVRNAEATGVEIRPSDRLEELVHVSERQLLVALADLPSRLARHEGDSAAQRRALGELADLVDEWRHPVRPMTVAERPARIHGARLRLAQAAIVVLRNGLARLGEIAPERM